MAGMTAQEAAEWGKTLDFPTVWAALMKGEEKIDKIGERVDRVTTNVDKMAERVDRMAERVDRVTANVDRMAERVDRVTANVGGLNLSMGDLIETLFAPHLGEKFDAYNYNLKRMFRRVPIYDDDSRLRSDIDILLSNTTVCMAVEVKRWLETTNHVDEHIKRMQLIRQYPPAEVKGKKLLGAIVGAVVTPEAREYAEQTGFFVLELTGEDVRLLEPPKDFQPKEW
jgi:outer membrane murein-binding lipoprotein Lpp